MGGSHSAKVAKYSARKNAETIHSRRDYRGTLQEHGITVRVQMNSENGSELGNEVRQIPSLYYERTHGKSGGGVSLYSTVKDYMKKGVHYIVETCGGDIAA